MIPTSHDRTFIPYVLTTDLKFERCLPNTLVQEGGYSNDPHDPGGRTMEGVIQKEYDLKRRQWGLPTQWVKNISTDEMRTIYYTDYWQPHCPLLPAGLDLECFDICVNQGPHEAIVLLQRALLVDADGDFGTKSQAALVLAIENKRVVLIIDRYKEARETFYRSLHNFQFFGGDWIRRSETIDKQSDAMAAGT